MIISNEPFYIHDDCPLYGGRVTEGQCVDMHFVAERLIKETILPDRIRKIPNFREICFNCKNHRQD